MLRNFLTIFLSGLFGIAFGQAAIDHKDPLWTKALAISQNTIILDGHVDMPYRMGVKNFRPTMEYLGIPVSGGHGDFDWERARQGGLDVPFMAVYIPSSYQAGGAKAFGDEIIDMIDTIIAAHPDKFAHAYTTADVYRNFDKGLLSLPMGMENGAGIEDDLRNLKHFYDRGIRYITLTHATDNLICDSSYDKKKTWGGLSPFGKKVVREMNRLGIMVDISHISDRAVKDVLAITQSPVIASHSSARKFTPGWERNLSDDLIKALAKNGGVIQINFGSTFLDKEVDKKNNANRKKLDALLEGKGLTADQAEAKPHIEEFKRKNPTLYADVEAVFKHIDYVVKLVGIDHVGLGSDFDGVGDSLPTGLKDVSQYPNLIYLMLKNGYSESEIAQICSGNVMRVWRENEKIARQMQSRKN
jgi:membrane dipeptidase